MLKTHGKPVREVAAQLKQRVIEDMAGQRHRASHDAWTIQKTCRRTRLAAAA
ncbi:MAG: hypothetical protein KF834_08565 [Burkholderiales bacterium]|nr:hypothetical protein [Burkholderiales bacterium]